MAEHDQAWRAHVDVALDNRGTKMTRKTNEEQAQEISTNTQSSYFLCTFTMRNTCLPPIPIVSTLRSPELHISFVLLNELLKLLFTHHVLLSKIRERVLQLKDTFTSPCQYRCCFDSLNVHDGRPPVHGRQACQFKCHGTMVNILLCLPLLNMIPWSHEQTSGTSSNTLSRGSKSKSCLSILFDRSAQLYTLFSKNKSLSGRFHTPLMLETSTQHQPLLVPPFTE